MAEYFGELVPGVRHGRGMDLVAGRIYYVELEGSPTGAGTLPDGVLNLYSTYWVTRSGEPWMEVGERLASDDDAGVGYNARIVFTPPATDWYIVEVAGYGSGYNSGSSGTYRLRVFEDDFRNSIEGDGAAGSLDALSPARSGTVNYAGDSTSSPPH